MTAAEAPGLVRVTVTSSTRRTDLVLPGAVAVAELVPELARSVGLLDVVTVPGGYRLLTLGGRILATDVGLTSQGVQDGSVITVAAGVDDAPPRVYDDVVEAMADTVERELQPWDPSAARRTSLAAAVALLVLAAAGLVTQPGSETAAAAAGATAAVLLTSAVVLSRMRGQTGAAVTVALVGCGHAAVAGSLVGPGARVSGTSLAAGGGAALVAGLVAVLALSRGRTLLLPAVLGGAVFLATGVAERLSSLDAAVVLTVALTLVVIADSCFPALALGSTGTGVDPPYPAAGLTDLAPIDAQRVAADARTAHELLLGLSVSVGLLLVLAAAPAVSLGPAGVTVSVLACVVVMLRTRRFHAGAQVLVGVASGVLGLLTTSAAVLWLYPTWRPFGAVALVACGLVLLMLTLLPRLAALRRDRWGDVAGNVALLALLPTLVVATGALSGFRG